MCLAQLEKALKEIGVVPAKEPPPPPRKVNLKGNYYPDGDIPF